MKNLLNSPLFQLAFAALSLWTLFRVIQAIMPSFESLPVSGIDNTRQQQSIASGADLKNLYPLVAAHINKPTPSESSEIISIDDAFIPKTQVTVPATETKAPDYFTILKTSNILNLQATTNSGAFINNRYYAYKTPLTEFAYPANGKQVTPIVRQSTTPNTVQIVENPGKSQFTITLSKE